MSIPKKIHYCWVGGGEMPENNLRYIESWKKFCPDYEIIRWDESNYDFTQNKYMADAYAAKKWGFVPDYARIDIVYQNGGIYLDTDVEIVKNLDPLLSDTCFFAFDKVGQVNLGGGFGGEAGSETLRRLRDAYDTLSFYNADGTLNLVPSPLYTTRFLKDMDAFAFDGTMQRKNGVAVYPWQCFDPYNGLEGTMKTNETTFTIHWYDASWLDAKQKKYVVLMGKYQRRFGKKLGMFLFWPVSMVYTYGALGAV
ncbi:MAG: glycosyltransferase, partial [Ruthenibacterium sp.]